MFDFPTSSQSVSFEDDGTQSLIDYYPCITIIARLTSWANPPLILLKHEAFQQQEIDKKTNFLWKI